MGEPAFVKKSSGVRAGFPALDLRKASDLGKREIDTYTYNMYIILNINILPYV